MLGQRLRVGINATLLRNVDNKLDPMVARLMSTETSVEDAAEFIRIVQGEQSVRALKNLLPALYADFGGVILGRIAELLPDEDFKLYLSLALWNHHNGYDNEAIQFLEKAQSIAPFDQETMRCDLWLSVANGEEEATEKCRILLQTYPSDQWARQLCQLVAGEGQPRSIESPHWDNPWEDLINGEPGM
jgi:hypothetical protein